MSKDLGTLEDHARVLRYRVISDTATFALFSRLEEAQIYVWQFTGKARKGQTVPRGLRIVDDVTREVVDERKEAEAPKATGLSPSSNRKDTSGARIIDAGQAGDAGSIPAGRPLYRKGICSEDGRGER